MSNPDIIMKLLSNATVLPPVSHLGMTFEIHVYNTGDGFTRIASIRGNDEPRMWAIIRENTQRMINDLISHGEDVRLYSVQS